MNLKLQIIAPISPLQSVQSGNSSLASDRPRGIRCELEATTFMDDSSLGLDGLWSINFENTVPAFDEFFRYEKLQNLVGFS